MKHLRFSISLRIYCIIGLSFYGLIGLATFVAPSDKGGTLIKFEATPKIKQMIADLLATKKAA